MESDQLDYAWACARNRETFLLNYPNDFKSFDELFFRMRRCWQRVATERDLQNRSHVGLLEFVNIVDRHAILGFQHIITYQSYLAWYVFRPGLEALLMLGNWVDDPANAETWRRRRDDRRAYREAFAGQGLVSESLPRSADMRRVLDRINDEYMHPNPDFTAREETVTRDSDSVTITVQFFDLCSEAHEANLLAYLNLVDVIHASSSELIDTLYGPPSGPAVSTRPFAEVNADRARRLVQSYQPASDILEGLGLWPSVT